MSEKNEWKPIEARWYAVDKAGAATLCTCEQDAQEVAAEAAQLYPQHAPYTAVQLVPAPSAPGDAQDERPPLFWYRPRSDDGYEGPIHNDRIEDVRKRSGAWVPLYPGFATLPKPLSDLRYHGEFIRGWNQCLREVSASVAAPAAGDALAWQGLTDAERDGYVGELVDYGSDFVAPLYSVVESIEKRLREKNAALAAQVPHKGDAA